jgi:hypothetical protein
MMKKIKCLLAWSSQGASWELVAVCVILLDLVKRSKQSFYLLHRTTSAIISDGRGAIPP